jgi:hypothetical protein
VRRLLFASLVLIGLLSLPGCGHGAAAKAWPFKRLQLGMANPPGDAALVKRSAPFGFRYQYLSAGVNTGQSWQTWGHGHGTFVSDYIQESKAHGMVPVFSYYQLRQSRPGASIGDEATADLTNLRDPGTMRAYYEDLKAFFRRCSRARGPVVLHVEPDLWGYVEQHATHNDASTVPAAVASSGMPGLQRLPNTVAGFAKAVLVLRTKYARHVIVGYHASIWGTGKALPGSHPSDSTVRWMAAKAASFYRSLHAGYDVVFSELADRDAGYAQVHDGGGAKEWWSSTDFAHDVRFLKDFHGVVHLPIVLWQIPVGNTLMRAMNNTRYHYQDNKVQFLLGENSRTLLRSYLRAGVTALLFGSGHSEDTCACDEAHDGVTNPAPINGNTLRSLSADDDGGYFRARAAAYYRNGAIRLPSVKARGG